MQEIDYDKALKMVIKDPSYWKHRNNPIGQKVIIKSLILARINHYILSTLQNPTEALIKKIEQHIFKLSGMTNEIK